MNANTAFATANKSPESTAGSILIFCAVSSLIAAAHHPVVRAKDATKVFARIAAASATDQQVHGALIVAAAALVFSFCVFSRRQGFHRPMVLAAFVCYAFGTAGFVGAGLLDGFFVPAIASQYAGASHTVATAGVALLSFCAIGIQLFTKFGVIAMCVATLLWSASLLRAGRAPLYAALAGIAVALGQIFILATGAPMTAHSIVFVVGAQALWYLAVGLLLIRAYV